jgi:hypothetical protein
MERAVDRLETLLHLGTTCAHSGKSTVSVMLMRMRTTFLITHARLQPPKPVHVTGNTNGTSDVSSPSDHGTLKGQQRRLASARSTGSELWVLWMSRQAPKGVLGLAPLLMSVV